MSTGSGILERREERWRQEAAFFDEVARRQDKDATRLALDPLTLRRYAGPRLRRRFVIEFCFRLLGDLRGRSLLDVGCGEGQNAALFARLGATVTGIDVSPAALEVARQRAEANGVADRVRFVCAPVETAEFPAGSFDVVWGEGILHHLLDELDLVLAQLARWTRPDGLLLFSEPVNLNHALRRLRLMIPLETEHTPGERPLEQAELDLVARHVAGLRLRHYRLLARLDRFILPSLNYERSSVLRRGLLSLVTVLDEALLCVPPARSLASVCVLWGRPAKSPGGLSA
jgi:2-polyprenyl-3-methyl-5-hydroxy-6-metoxy-1,4-benzoquinol methylase